MLCCRTGIPTRKTELCGNWISKRRHVLNMKKIEGKIQVFLVWYKLELLGHINIPVALKGRKDLT